MRKKAPKNKETKLTAGDAQPGLEGLGLTSSNRIKKQARNRRGKMSTA